MTKVIARRETAIGSLSCGMASVLLAALVISGPALAQDAKPAAKEGAKAASAEKKSAWVKLCEKAPVPKKDKDGKAVKEEKELCLTHHERLDGNTGMVMVSAAVREIDGRKSFMIMVPLGMALPPGVKAAVYTKDQWAKAAKKEDIDEKALKPVSLKYALCHPAGCTAEAEATGELLEQMKTGGGIMVLAMNAAGQPVGFPVPLDGFNEASAGPPVDNKKYAEARGALMQQIRQRQAQLMDEFKKKEMAKLPPPPGGATGSTAPAEKK